MKTEKPNLRKSLAIFGAILTGGTGVTFLALLPLATDAGAAMALN
jgi:hypothetical protein